MLIGQASTHAWQDVQAQISSSEIKSLNNFFPSSLNSPEFASLFPPISSIRSLQSIMIFLGDNVFPVLLAGQTEVHLPHSVHE